MWPLGPRPLHSASRSLPPTCFLLPIPLQCPVPQQGQPLVCLRAPLPESPAPHLTLGSSCGRQSCSVQPKRSGPSGDGGGGSQETFWTPPPLTALGVRLGQVTQEPEMPTSAPPTSALRTRSWDLSLILVSPSHCLVPGRRSPGVGRGPPWCTAGRTGTLPPRQDPPRAK